MDKEKAAQIVEALGVLVQGVQHNTGAPVIIILAMGALSHGSVLSSCVGPRDTAELATALRFAADALHIHQPEKGKPQ